MGKKINKIAKLKDNDKFFKVDEYGIKEWKLWFKIGLAISILYSYIFIAALPLYYFETDVVNSNIHSYRDAVWLLQMAASTIGFGDVYPVTELGRFIVAVSFYIGVGLAGFVGGSIAMAFTSFTENDIKNRELRAQIDSLIDLIYEQNKMMENMQKA